MVFHILLNILLTDSFPSQNSAPSRNILSTMTRILHFPNRSFLFAILLIKHSVNSDGVSEVRVIEEKPILAVNDNQNSSEIPELEVISPEESLLGVEEVILPEQKPTLSDIYLSQIGVRELTGKNDGPEVEIYLKSVGLGKGYSWCSAFVKWSLDQVEISNKINAWSPTAENKSNLIYQTRRFISEPEPGDVFTLYYPKLKRIGHTGFFHQKQNESIIVTVEGNTNEAGSREGDGVYKKYRSLKTIHSISRWR